MSRKRVALVLSGGVSLGSYIAGALDELLRALKERPDEFVIDVITGASAGATTAALIAHGLLYRNGETDLHKVWVKQIDMYDLLAPELAADQPPTLLSNVRLKEVAASTLAWPSASTKWERSPLCAPTLTVALTLTNVEGLSYVSRVKMAAANREEAFIQDRHAEQETFKLDLGVQPTDSIWQRISQVGIASAALPFVFPPVVLRRTADDTRQYIHRPAFEGSAEFLYSDGGMFNNLPIDLAWHYARQNDSGADERWLVIIDPSQDQVRALSSAPPTARPAYRNPLNYALQMVAAMRAESTAIQFDREVLLPSKMEQGDVARVQGALPGVDRAHVDLLDNVALVLPEAGSPRLTGSHLIVALSAFLDERFREYDFRRGAADARRVVADVLRLDVKVPRSQGEAFYRPDEDPGLRFDLSSYAALDTIRSSRFPGKSVRAVFEERLSGRIKALVGRLNPPGPNLFYTWLARRMLLPRLGNFWE